MLKFAILFTIALGLYAQGPSFKTASVRPISKPPDRTFPLKPIVTSPTSLTIPVTSLAELIAWAYDVNNYQITGEPLPENHYQIVAKSAVPVTRSQLQLMLQTLLANQFGLRFHRDSKVLTGYVLTKGKEPKLEPAEGVDDMAIMPSPTSLAFTHVSMLSLCVLLSDRFEQVVMDETGLKGEYNFTIDISRYFSGGLVDTDNLFGEGAVFFRAVQDQLGLKLEKRKSAVDVLVVDKWEKPAGN
jgi:uncharacterized protein (TIGR03435 family)